MQHSFVTSTAKNSAQSSVSKVRIDSGQNEARDWKVISPVRKNSTPLPTLIPFSSGNSQQFGSIWDSPLKDGKLAEPLTYAGVLIPPMSIHNDYQLEVNSFGGLSQHHFDDTGFTMPLKTGEDYDAHSPLLPQHDFNTPFGQKSRSKSTSATFGQFRSPFTSPTLKPLILSPTTPNGVSPWEHRRASTTPSQANWDDDLLQNSSHDDILFQRPQSNSYGSPNLQKQFDQQAQQSEQNYSSSYQAYDNFSTQRRFSHAQHHFFEDYVQSPSTDVNDVGRRRHSMAELTQQMRQMNTEPQPAEIAYGTINDYFENTETRTKAWYIFSFKESLCRTEAGKNLKVEHAPSPTADPEPSPQFPIYVIEFKAGRRDFFYLESASQNIATGDLVIVEADRGKDLGKVTCDNLMSMHSVERYQTTHPDILSESPYGGKVIVPKKVFRRASPNEISHLVPKSQDESSALKLCKEKIKARKLPMEVVDAEYQWDRRKLTFYFVADKRIDFRDLVKELFKFYKTRIWMCAVNHANV